jgi:glucokinase
MVNRAAEDNMDGLSAATKILGLNISGSKTIAVYGDMNGLIYERIQEETPADLPFLEGFDAVCSMVDKLLKICRAQGLSSPEVLSLAVSGPVDLLKGVVLSPPDLPLWDEGKLKGRLSVRYNLPVFIDHRSSANALAELHFGAGTGTENLIFLDLEPVVTAGLILQGNVYHGSNDAAGDIGRMHMSDDGPAGLGSPGSLTGFASGPGMAELASLRFPEIWQNPPRPYNLVKAVNDNQPEALRVVEEAADYLGKALTWLIFTFDPEMVIVGHPGDVLGESLLTPLREAVLKHGGGEALQLPRLTASELGAKLDDVAAIMPVVDQFKNPSSS